LRRGLANDFVVFSGGSSVGERDIVVDVVKSLGDILFHGVAVKPGKPTSLGRVVGKPVLGLPGYPTSCLINGYLLLAPMLRRMARLPAAQPQIVGVPLGKRIDRATGRLEFHTVRIVDGQAFSAFKESSAIVAKQHFGEPFDLPPSAGRGFWNDVMLVAKCVAELFSPVKMNYELHGNTVPHLHVHIYPRYRDDPYVGGPIDPRRATFAR